MDAVAAWQKAAAADYENYGGGLGQSDLNGDGYSDVIIGAPGTNDAYLMKGAAYFLSLHLSAWAPQQSGMAAVGDLFGAAVAGGGDFNGDGYADVLLGSPGYHVAGTNEGAAYAYLGNGRYQAGGRAVNPRQYEARPIAVGGRGAAPGNFFVGVSGFSAYGRADVRLRWRAVPLGQDLTTATDHFTPWMGSGAPQAGSGSIVSLADAVTGLTANTEYHWQVKVESKSPFFPGTPWRWANGSTPAVRHLRTPGPLSQPDLTVVSISPATAHGGVPTVLSAVIANNGLAAAGTCVADVRLDGGSVCTGVVVPALAAGATTTVQCDLGYLAGGNRSVEVLVDTGAAVAESDETNNSLTASISVTNYFTLYLAADGSGSFPTLQAAYDVINPGGTIVLSDGVYTGAGNRDLAWSSKSVTVRSASGNPDLCAIDLQGSAASPHHGFVPTSGVQLTLQNITVRGGYASSGSALGVNSATIVASGCVFSGGEATNAGGACNMLNAGGSFTDCRFSGNHAVWGGGGLYLNN